LKEFLKGDGLTVKKIYLFILILILIGTFSLNLSAETKIEKVRPVRKGNIAVFINETNSPAVKILLSITRKNLLSVFYQTGRFLPVEDSRIVSVFQNNPDGNNVSSFKEVAKKLNLSLYIVLDGKVRGRTYYAQMKILPLNKNYKKLNVAIRVKSKILKNIPLKLSLEILKIIKKVPLFATITEKRENSSYLINVGEWDGLKKSTVRTYHNNSIKIVELSRYYSLIYSKRKLPISIKIKLFPETYNLEKDLKDRILDNLIAQYGVGAKQLKGEDPEKKLLESVCIVNFATNSCIPAYGAYLSTSYLGFKNSNPSIAGVVVSASVLFGQLMMGEFVSGFKTWFLPFLYNDALRTDSNYMQAMDLQNFLWITIPFGFTVAYLDQLAFQFHQSNLLPPFFKNYNIAAFSFSVFIPGGGLFYKGHRLLGWTYYLSEMVLGGLGAYWLKDPSNDKKFVYAFIGLGIVKLIELVNAILIAPSYSSFKYESEPAEKRNYFYIGLDSTPDGEGVLKVSLVHIF